MRIVNKADLEKHTETSMKANNNKSVKFVVNASTERLSWISICDIIMVQSVDFVQAGASSFLILFKKTSLACWTSNIMIRLQMTNKQLGIISE